MVVTLDLAAKGLQLLKTHHWLSDPRNVVTLHLDSQAWQQLPGPAQAILAPGSLGDLRQTMSRWPCAEVAEFLEGHDLEGPAKTLAANGVRGQDLLSFDALTLMRDVGLRAFAAKRVIDARDLFLRGGT